MPDYVYDPAWEQGSGSDLPASRPSWTAARRQCSTVSGCAPDGGAWRSSAGGGSVVEWLAVARGRVGPRRRHRSRHAIRRAAHFRSSRRGVTTSPPTCPRGGLRPRADPGSCWALRRARRARPARGCHAPGGWVVIEDYDWTGFRHREPATRFRSARVTRSWTSWQPVADLSSTTGGERARQGADSSTSGARARLRTWIDSDDPGFAFFELSFEASSSLSSTGRLTQDEADEVSARLEAPDARIITWH